MSSSRLSAGLVPLTLAFSLGCAPYESSVPGGPPATDPDPEFTDPTGPQAAFDADRRDPVDPVPPPPSPGDFEWARGFAGPSADTGYGVAVDGAGEIALAGSFQYGLDLGGGMLESPGGFAAAVASYRPDGSHMWSQSSTGTGNHAAYAIAIDGEGDRIVVGTFSGRIDLGGESLVGLGSTDIFVAKLSRDGEVRWARRLGGADTDSGVALAVGDQGQIAVGGASGGDVYLAMLGADGELAWERAMGGAGDDAASGVAIDGDGSLALVGRLGAPGSLGGDLLASAGGGDGFVARYAPGGEHVWSLSLGGAGDDEAAAVAIDAEGGLVVAGSFGETMEIEGDVAAASGRTDVFLSRYAPDGALTWTQPFGGPGADAASALAIAPDGDLLMAGTYEGAMDAGGELLAGHGGQDLFVARYSSAGEPRWSRGFGGSGRDFASAIAARADGGVLVTGAYQGRIDFGGGDLVFSSDSDLFLLSLSE